MHKCQGFGQLLALPGPASSSISSPIPRARRTTSKDEQSPFDGLDLTFSALSPFAGTQPPAALVSESRIPGSIKAADERLRADGPDAAGGPLATGLLKARRGCETCLACARPRRQRGISRFASGWRRPARNSRQALVAAHGLRFEALADDGVVVPGQPIKMTLIAANRGRDAVALDAIAIEGLDGLLQHVRQAR